MRVSDTQCLHFTLKGLSWDPDKKTYQNKIKIQEEGSAIARRWL